MGLVREALDLRLDRRVAVKFLRADLADLPRARRRFEREARAAARLSHPNVVIVFDSGEEGDVPYLVMERLSGATLADEMSGKPLPLERVRAVASDVLSALAAAHRAGIVHRDIKPGNVLLTDDGHVKVSDFGIAKTVDEIDPTLTTQVIATPAYLAPERLSGQPATPQSDLYSVGVMLYEALSGRRPFTGETPLAVMRAVERADPPPLEPAERSFPSAIARAVERAMSPDPEHRFASADEMAAAIEPTSERTTTKGSPTELAPIAASATTVPLRISPRDGATVALPPGPSERPRARRRRAFGIGATALVALLLTGGALSRTDHGSAPATPATATPRPTQPSPALPAPLDDALRRLERAVGS
jgi:eukaryotic-like serine/threonine-protein kinase